MRDSPGKKYFVSYAREDGRVIRQLIKLVALSGAHTFLDQNDIPPGADWQQAIAGAIAQADAIIVFWSLRARASKWVKTEWESGLKLGKVVIPVLMDSAPLPPRLSRLQWIDLRVGGYRGVRPVYGSLLGRSNPDDQVRLLRHAAARLSEVLGKP